MSKLDVCSRCGDWIRCWDFKEHGNDGKKSYTIIKPICRMCFHEMNFPLSIEELRK